MKPTQTIRELDGSTIEYTDLPIHPGTAPIAFNQPLRLPEIRARSREELGTLLSLAYDLFVRNWSRVRFGPCIEGAVFELSLTAEPVELSMLDGYLTVELPPGPQHFHLCIAPTEGLGDDHCGKTPQALAKKRQCSRAAFFRVLSERGAPTSWGVRLWNGEGLQMLTVFLPSPFLDDRLKRLREPDWSRLALWHELRRRYLGESPDEQSPQT